MPRTRLAFRLLGGGADWCGLSSIRLSCNGGTLEALHPISIHRNTCPRNKPSACELKVLFPNVTAHHGASCSKNSRKQLLVHGYRKPPCLCFPNLYPVCDIIVHAAEAPLRACFLSEVCANFGVHFSCCVRVVLGS